MDQKTDKPLLMVGLDSCRRVLEVISFRLVPKLTDLEPCDFGGYIPVGLDQKTDKPLLMVGLESCQRLLEVISYRLVPSLTNLKK